MALFTSRYLTGLTERVTLNESERMFSASKSRSTFDIFLSQSFLDKKEEQGLYIELTRMGFSVYVDWIVDPHLDRNNVTKQTATIVRNRLHSSRSLLLAISINASLSKWMPWELGYVDGNTSKCAVVPVSKSENPPSSYKGAEYLSLYPFITRQYSQTWVVEEANKYVDFNSWITGTKPYTRTTKIY
jgi:hypothetical protein